MTADTVLGLPVGDKIIMRKLKKMGVKAVAWRWWYDPQVHRDAPFGLHRRLHARVIAFENFPVPAAGWPNGLFPGDHIGCLCQLSRLFQGPDGRFLAR